MTDIGYLEIDKSDWPEGPWQNEPDIVEFTDEEAGLPCLIIRIRDLGHLCGYVGVESKHRLFNKGYDRVEDISVHGGITYAGPRPHGEDDGMWWFGFDAAHYDDFLPVLESKMYQEILDGLPSIFDPRSYKNINYMKSECVALAHQLTERRGRWQKLVRKLNQRKQQKPK